MPDVLLGWDEHLDADWQELGQPGAHGTPGRVSRIDRGWSTILRHAADAEPLRVRNIGADVAVGDWVVVDEAVERVAHVIGRRSAFVRRASHEGDRAEADVLAANIDVVFLVHALTAPPNQRRLERELVLAFDSGAQPQIVLTKSDVADDIEATVDELRAVAAGVPVHIASGITGVGLEPIRAAAEGGRTLAFFRVAQCSQLVECGKQFRYRNRHPTCRRHLYLPGEGKQYAGLECQGCDPHRH